MRKELHDRLILVEADPSVYEQAQRCRCPECKGLYALREEDIIAHALCGGCKKPLFRREQLQVMWKGAQTLLQRARKLDRARGQVAQCPHCKQSMATENWCPLSFSLPHLEAANGLPQNPTVVWVRTFHIGESLEELQVREWGEEETEIEVESNTTEVSPDAQEHDE
jgi:hypothetical protein